MSVFSELAIDGVRLTINSAIIGAVLALVAALAFRLAPNLHPRIRYALAVASFFAAVIFPVFAAFQIFEQNAPPALIVQNSQIENSAEIGIGSANDFTVQPTLNQNPSPATESFSNEIPAARPVITISPTLANVFLLLWAGVAFLLLAREIFGHLSFVKMRRKWQPADEAARRRLQLPDNVSVYLSDGENPLAIGFFRTAIVLPARLCEDLSIEAARQIARHELNHLRWRDPSVNALLRIIRALFWINPSLWYLERAARMEREAAADFAVVKNDNFEPETIAAYAEALVEVAKWSTDSTAVRRRFRFVATEAGRRSGLEKRVRRLFQASTRLDFLRRTLAFSAFCAGLCGIYFLPLASSANSSNNAWIAAESGAESFFPSASVENAAPEILRLDNSSTLPAKLMSETFTQTLRNIVGIQESEQATNKPENIEASENLGETPQPDIPIENSSIGNTPRAQINTSEQPSFAPTPPNIGITPRADQTAPGNIEQPTPQNYEAPPNFIRDGMAAVGYANLADEEIAALKRVGASHFTVRELASVGYTNLSVKTLIRLREAGVSATYIKEMRAFGYDNLSPEMLVDFRWHSVSAAYIREMASLGYGNLTAKMLIAFRRNSVSAAYINEMRALVKGGISADEIVDMKWLAVSRQFIGDLGALGYRNLTANQLINMRQHGVTTAFIEKMRARDGKNYSANDLISMRMNGER